MKVLAVLSILVAVVASAENANCMKWQNWCGKGNEWMAQNCKETCSKVKKLDSCDKWSSFCGSNKWMETHCQGTCSGDAIAAESDCSHVTYSATTNELLLDLLKHEQKVAEVLREFAKIDEKEIKELKQTNVDVAAFLKGHYEASKNNEDMLEKLWQEEDDIFYEIKKRLSKADYAKLDKLHKEEDKNIKAIMEFHKKQADPDATVASLLAEEEADLKRIQSSLATNMKEQKLVRTFMSNDILLLDLQQHELKIAQILRKYKKYDENELAELEKPGASVSAILEGHKSQMSLEQELEFLWEDEDAIVYELKLRLSPSEYKKLDDLHKKEDAVIKQIMEFHSKTSAADVTVQQLINEEKLDIQRIGQALDLNAQEQAEVRHLMSRDILLFDLQQHEVKVANVLNKFLKHDKEELKVLEDPNVDLAALFAKRAAEQKGIEDELNYLWDDENALVAELKTRMSKKEYEGLAKLHDDEDALLKKIVAFHATSNTDLSRLQLVEAEKADIKLIEEALTVNTAEQDFLHSLMTTNMLAQSLELDELMVAKLLRSVLYRDQEELKVLESGNADLQALHAQRAKEADLSESLNILREDEKHIIKYLEPRLSEKHLVKIKDLHEKEGVLLAKIIKHDQDRHGVFDPTVTVEQVIVEDKDDIDLIQKALNLVDEETSFLESLRY